MGYGGGQSGGPFVLLKGLVYGSLWSPDCASQLEISQQSSVCSVLCDLLSPVCFACPLLLSPLPGMAPCSETWPFFCWPQCSFAWLWYQIVGIPDEIPCPACQRRCCDCHPHPHKCPLPEPVLVLTLRLSSKVPFLDPECGGSLGWGPWFPEGLVVSAALTRFSSVVLWQRREN